MKNVLAAMFAVSLLAGFSAAQPHKGGGGRPGMGPGGGGGGGDELSQEQREKVQAAMKAEREAGKALQRDLRDAMMRLSDLLEDEASDKELQAGMDRVEKAQKALEDQREKSQAKIRALLPIRQRAMMMVRMGQGMGAGHMGMMRHGMGGPGMHGPMGGGGGPGMHGGMGGPGMGGGGPGMRGGPDDEDEDDGPGGDHGGPDAEP